jgi:monoamine oxidase
MQHPVVIVGAGAAGLYAAHVLQKEHNIPVELVEAADYVGGRVKQDWKFSGNGRPIEIGGELVHGENNMLGKMVRELGLDTADVFSVFQVNTSRPEYEYFYLGRERKLFGLHSDDADLKHLYKLIGELEENPPKGDVSFMQWLVDHGLPYRMLGVADALYAKTWGTTVDKLSAVQFAVEQAAANEEEGEGNLQVKQSYAPVIQRLQKDLKIHLNWPVKKIDYTNPDAIKVTNARGETVLASQVIITVSLKVLQEGDIQFVPSLPQDKLRGIAGLRMDAGMKIFAKFNKTFWQEKHHLVICADTFVPQFWTYGKDVPIVTGFVTGDQAAAASALPPRQAADSFIKQLDAVYGTESNPRPATDAFVDFMIQDWTKQPYVRGSYSAPSVGGNGCREALAKPIGRSIFFGGEATSLSAAATIHGAMATGQRAAEDLLKARQQKVAKL